MQKKITFSTECFFDDAIENEDDVLMDFVSQIKEMRTGEMIEEMIIENIEEEQK